MDHQHPLSSNSHPLTQVVLTRSLPAAFCLLLLLITPHTLLIIAVAQSATATLSGTIEDQNGAVVSGATVTIENAATGLKRQTTTGEQGSFTVPLLSPGKYTLRAQHDGFTTAEIRNIVLNVGDQKGFQIQLKTGNVSETVNVTAETPLINESPAVATVVDRQFVSNVPLNGRSFQSLITLAPGVVMTPATAQQGQFSVNGQRADANVFTIDGVSGNFGAAVGFIPAAQTSGSLPGLTALGTTQSLASIDALQEFSIQTSTYSAEFGRQPGAQISIVTRSGTNQFHGNLFDYLRNDKFDANDWFANSLGKPRAKERQNDFGGTLGGPVVLPGYSGRDRTFFFFSYEGLRLRLPQFAVMDVPTLSLRQTAPAPLQPILNGFPLPNGRDLGNGLAEFSSSYSDPSTLNAASIRIDHMIGARFNLFGRYNWAPSESDSRSVTQSFNRITERILGTKTLTIGLNALITQRLTNELRVNYSDNFGALNITLDNSDGAVPPPRSALIPSQYDSGEPQGFVRLSFPGATAPAVLGSPINDFLSTQRQYNEVDNVFYQVASHQFKFGIDYRHLTPQYAANTYQLSVVFTSQQQVLNATADSAQIVATSPANPVYDNFSAFAQDTWKAGQRLVFNLGVRWDVNPAPGEATGLHPLAVTQIDNLATMDRAPSGTSLWRTRYGKVAPRFGVAYQLRQKTGRETVLRGGFGVFYDTGNEQGSQAFNAFPFLAVKSVTNAAFPLSAANAAPPTLPDPANLTPPYSSSAGGPTLFDPHLKLPYTLQWNFSVEQSLGKDQSISVSYVGAAGRSLLQQRTMTLTAINPKFTTIKLITNRASSDYNGLQAQFRRRLSHGLQALASYTWSHALDDDSSDNGTIRPVHGNAAFDIRHIFSSAVTYDIPTLRNKVSGAVMGHWSLDSNFHAQTASPVDITGSTFTSPIDGSLVAARANVIDGVPIYLYGPQYPGGRIINNTVPTAAQVAAAGCAPLTATNAKGAFCTPPIGTFGNLGRNVVRALPAWQEDLALHRVFKLTERLNLQFRAEAFNVFNHPNFGAISTFLAAANFGQATNMLGRQLGGLNALYQIGGPRSFQFALKLAF